MGWQLSTVSRAAPHTEVETTSPRLAGEIGMIGAPLAVLYGAGVLARRWAYDRGLLRAWSPPVQTISVGGLEAGGTGKTQVAQLLLDGLARAGRRPGLVTRGYRRRVQGLVVRRRGEAAIWEALGDEPAMVVNTGLDLPIVACADRCRGVRALLEAEDCDVLVLDDGFAHRALGRHLDVVVLRGEAPLANGHLLPWGSLREPASSLGRADVVWLHYRCRAPHGDGEPVWPKTTSPRALRVVSYAQPTGATTIEGAAIDLTGARVIAAAGIARPAELAVSLERLGAEVLELVAFADHAFFCEADLDRLLNRAWVSGADGVVVTPKDAVKLARFTHAGDLWVAGTRVVVCNGGDRLEALLGIELPARSDATSGPG